VWLGTVLCARALATPPSVPPDLGRLAAYEQTLRANPTDLRTAATYRQAIIQAGQYDRAIDVFKNLVDRFPRLAEPHLNLAFAFIDKVPVSGKMRQAFLGRDAIDQLTKAIEIRPSPLAYYSRGLINLFYDALMFKRVPYGVADLERGFGMVHDRPLRPYHARFYVTMGDAYWKAKDTPRAKTVWKEGLQLFPDNIDLRRRVVREGKDLEWTVRDVIDPDRRVDTSLKDIWDDVDTLK
jgi:tetratricopeptide (TPR) repeat protein